MTLRDARTLAVFLVALVGATGGVAPTVLSAGAATATDAAIPIDGCETIDEPGTYLLTTDIENGGKTRISGTCIEITADDVTFDGNGHTIDGRGVSHTKGIGVTDAENVVVEDVAVNDWHAGVLVADGSATVRDVRTFSNAYGVRLESASGTAVRNATIEENLVGVYTDTEDVTLEDNDLSGNEISVRRDLQGTDFRRPPARLHAVTPRP